MSNFVLKSPVPDACWMSIALIHAQKGSCLEKIQRHGMAENGWKGHCLLLTFSTSSTQGALAYLTGCRHMVVLLSLPSDFDLSGLIANQGWRPNKNKSCLKTSIWDKWPAESSETGFPASDATEEDAKGHSCFWERLWSHPPWSSTWM